MENLRINSMQNQYIGRLGVAFFFAILSAFNGNIFSINLDDNRENPFRDINDFEKEEGMRGSGRRD